MNPEDLNQQSSSSPNYDDKDRSFSKTSESQEDSEVTVSDEPCMHSLRFKRLRFDDVKDSASSSDKHVSESQRRRKEEDDTDVAVSDDKDSRKRSVSNSDKDLSSSHGKLVKRRVPTSQQRRKEEDVVVSDELSWDSQLRSKRHRFSNDKDSDQRSAFPDEEELFVVSNLFELSLCTEKTQSPTQPQRHTPSNKKSWNCGSYKCDGCEKEFTSYQALGGHKASHKLQSVIGNANADASERKRRKMLPSGKVHKCSICSKIFETGQALGGHKRLHYKGPIGGHKRTQKETVVAGDKSSPSREEKLKGSDQGKDKVVREGDKWSPGSNGSAVINVSDQEHSVRRLLDLNEPPLLEIDEATDGGDVEEEVES